MKLLIREFLASMRERDELDAILPDLLSEIGFTVISRPGRGTTQYGVDVAAVGPNEAGDRALFLFSIKQGDLDRATWNGPTNQAVRPSLDEIRDAYIPTRIPPKYKDLPIVVCVCLGGEVKEQVQTQLTGYFGENSSKQVSYETWNGDHLAGLIMSGVLGENVILADLRSHFRKAIALVDEPDVSFKHFQALVSGLHKQAGKKLSSRVRAARQMYIALWVLFVWARDADNLESAYLGSEFVALHVWDLARHSLGKKSKQAKQISEVCSQSLNLYATVAEELLKKIVPHANTLHGLAVAVNSRSSVDVSLRLFDLIGRIALLGLWKHWSRQGVDADKDQEIASSAAELLNAAYGMISNNPALFLPVCEDQAIDAALLLMFATFDERGASDVTTWLEEMVRRFDIGLRTGRHYPTVHTEYRALLDHPKDNSEEYLKEATSGSILMPLIAAWLEALERTESVQKLADLHGEKIPHCTLQQWLPGADTEDGIYIGQTDNGIAIANLRIGQGDHSLIDELVEACDASSHFEELSCVRAGLWPLLLMACRHYRLPVPPNMWAYSLKGEGQDEPKPDKVEPTEK
jgi:hypothetical protein